jgi:hypothetical protein
MSRCISVLIGEEKRFPNTPEGRKKAAGRCGGIYDGKHSSSEIVEDREVLDKIKKELGLEDSDEQLLNKILKGQLDLEELSYGKIPEIFKNENKTSPQLPESV